MLSTSLSIRVLSTLPQSRRCIIITRGESLVHCKPKRGTERSSAECGMHLVSPSLLVRSHVTTPPKRDSNRHAGSPGRNDKTRFSECIDNVPPLRATRESAEPPWCCLALQLEGALESGTEVAPSGTRSTRTPTTSDPLRSPLFIYWVLTVVGLRQIER